MASDGSSMGKGLVALLLTLSLCTAAAAQGVCGASSSTEGSDFWVTKLINGDDGFHSSTGEFTTRPSQFELFVAGEPGTAVRAENPLTGWSASAVVGAQGWAQISTPSGYDTTFLLRPMPEGIHVTSDAPVTLTAMNARLDATDAASIMSTEALGTRYVVQDNGTYLYFGPQVAILAVEDSTLVSCVLPCSVGDGMRHTGDTVRQLLMRGEVYRLMAVRSGSFAGMEVASDGKPFALFEGHTLAYVPGDGVYAATDHLYEQALPVTKWGERYVLVPTCGRVDGLVNGDIVQVTAADSCAVMLGGQLVDILAPFETTEFTLPYGSAQCLTATAPVAVMQYVTSHGHGGDPGDPAVFVVTPADRGVCRAGFVVFNTANTTFTACYVNVAVPTEAVEGMLLDGDSVASAFAQVDSLYSYACIELQAGEHTLENDRGYFVGHVYALEWDESYAYALGMEGNFRIVEHPTLQASADGICPGEEVILTAEGTHSYRWHADPASAELDSLQGLNPIAVHPLQTTVYSLLDETGAVAVSVTVGVESVSLCVETNRDIIDFDYPVVTLRDCSPDGYNATWFFSDGMTLHGANVRRQFSRFLPDSLTVTLRSCNRYGCCADTTLRFEPEIRSVWFPNVFIPDGEENNRFGAVTSCQVAEYELFIYDRRGYLVWHSTDIRMPWDGTRDGKPAPQGGYVYKWYLEDIRGDRWRGIGTVVLVR